MSDAAANIWGYFSGYLSPSVVAESTGDFMLFAQIEAGRADKGHWSLSDKQNTVVIQRQARRGVGDHLRVKMAAFTGADLEWRAPVARMRAASPLSAGRLQSPRTVHGLSISSCFGQQVVLPTWGWMPVLSTSCWRAAKRARLRSARRLFCPARRFQPPASAADLHTSCVGSGRRGRTIAFWRSGTWGKSGVLR